jgi:hypothetical protein
MIRALLVFCILCFSLEAKLDKRKKYNLSVCSVFKNESPNLREWLEYHRLAGVDHFYLYENGSTDRYMNVLKPYINKKIVTLVPWPEYIKKEAGENLFQWVLGTQVPAYENALQMYAKKETKWIVFLDIDEFLIPVKGSSLGEVLDEYDPYPGVVISREFFDASSAGSMPSRGLVIESVDITQAPQVNIQECVEKVIFKPDQCIAFKWPPYECVFGEGTKSMKLDRNTIRINRYLNRNRGPINFRRKMHIDNRKIRDAELDDILNAGYDIEDQQRVIQRFVPDLVKKLSAS